MIIFHMISLYIAVFKREHFFQGQHGNDLSYKIVTLLSKCHIPPDKNRRKARRINKSMSIIVKYEISRSMKERDNKAFYQPSIYEIDLRSLKSFELTGGAWDER
jgi:hypothetical protein